MNQNKIGPQEERQIGQFVIVYRAPIAGKKLQLHAKEVYLAFQTLLGM